MSGMTKPFAFFAAALVAGCAGGDCRMKTGSTGALRHVVLFKFKDGAPPEAIRAIEERFRGLKSRIPGIVDFEWGTNVSPEKLDQGFTHLFFVTFPDDKARNGYLPHPAHLEFVEVLKPHLDKVLVVDYVARD
jgi:hypothetical protein